MMQSSSSEGNPIDDLEEQAVVLHPNTVDSSSEFTAHVDIAILEKEELLAKLMETVKNYASIKNEFEKLLNAINELETEKRSLETELELAKNVVTSSSQANSRNNPVQSCVALEQMKERFQKVKEELRIMREERKRKENTYKMVQRDSKQCELLEKELQKLKQSKVYLLKQQKQQTLQLQKMKKEQAQKLQLSKKSEVRKQQQLNFLKSELAKKDRVLGHRNKEINRLCAKLKVCEEHVAQLLKVQNRNRLKSCHSMMNLNSSDLNSAVSHSDRRGAFNNSSSQPGNSFDTEHYVSSKNMLNNIIMDKVERNQVQLLYVRKTRSLQQLNHLLSQEARELEDLIDDKRNFLNEVLRLTSADDEGLETEDILDNEAALVKQGVMCESDLMKLKQFNGSINLLELNIERLTAAIDTLNADLDDLSLKIEKENFGGFLRNAKFMSSEDSLSGTFSEKDSDSLWDSLGKEIVANLSLSQSHSLLWELVTEKASVLEMLKLNNEDLQHLQLNADMCSDRLKDAMTHMTMLKAEMSLRFEEAEARRINDVWLLSKASAEWQNASSAAMSAGEESESTNRDVAVPQTQAIVLSAALKKANDLEKQLDHMSSNEHRLQEENDRISKTVTSLEETISELKMKLHFSDNSSNETESGHLAEIGSSSKTSEGFNVLRNLSSTWLELGLPQSDRDEALNYVQSSRIRTLERVLADAQSMRSAVVKDAKLLDQTIATICNILGVSPREMYTKAHIPDFEESSSLLQKVKQLEIVKNVAEEEVRHLLPKLRLAKDRLLDVVAEMWLDILDVHPALQQVMRLKTSNLTQSQNSDSAEMLKVVTELSNANFCLADLDGVIEVEIRKLNLQRVQTTLKLIETRTETISLMDELAINQAHEVDQLFQACKLPSDGQSLIDDDSDALSSDAIKAAVHLVVVNSASNPPGSQKLLFALQRLKFILESAKVNRSTLFDLLARLLALCQESLHITNSTPQSQHVDSKFMRSELCQRLELVEAIESDLRNLQSTTESKIIAISRNMSNTTELALKEDTERDTRIASQIKLYKDQCQIAFNTGVSKSSVFDGIYSFESAMHDIISDLEGMAAFTEEVWLRDRISKVCCRWASPDSDLRVISRQARSP